MKIGTLSFVINPTFPVNRMLHPNDKHQDVHDDLHCRIVAIEEEGKKPFFHVSMDTAELWKYREDQIKEIIENYLGEDINIVASATHCHNCPCFTIDDDYVNYVYELLAKELPNLEFKEYNEVRYAYSYNYFDKLGKSRVLDYTTPHLYAETISLYGDGNRIVTWLMHNSHPTTKKLWVDDFTSEYPGYCIKALSEEYSNEFFTFLLGPAGDISSHFVRLADTYEEMERTAEILKNEFDNQLKNQKYEELEKVDFKYEETVIDNKLRDFSLDMLDIPEKLNKEEEQVISRYGKPSPFGQRELRDFETCETHTIAHLIFSKDYSIIFEPFELYSEFYGAVNKNKCSIATVSKGFEHYLTGLYLDRISMHGSFSNFSDETRKKMWLIFRKWSCQESID